MKLKSIHIPYIPAKIGQPAAELSSQLDNIARHELPYVLWHKPNVIPEVSFAIAHNAESIFLKFYVKEPSLIARYRKTNDPVYLDSCVEFFIAFGNDQNYYNLEFNYTGTCLGQFGHNKQRREYISPYVLSKLSAYTELKEPKGQLYAWELTLKLPAEIFTYHDRACIFQDDIRMNFYKGGEGLEDQHYLAWSEIKSAQPNFHVRTDFGTGVFEKPLHT